MKPPKSVLDLVHLKKDYTDAYVYQQLFMEIRDRYCDYIPVYTDGSQEGISVACATDFPSDTVISMSCLIQHPCLLLKPGQSLNPWNKLIDFTDSRSCLQALSYMKLGYPLIGMVMRECIIFNFAIF